MYYIEKQTTCWTITDDVIRVSRTLNAEEIERVKNEFPSLKDESVVIIKSNQIKSIASPPKIYHVLNP